MGGNPVNYTDPYGLWAWGDPVAPWLVNVTVGFGDDAYHAVTFGFGNFQQIRDVLDISNGGANPCSRDYRGRTGLAAWTGVGRLGARSQRKRSREGAG
ncbi:MAG: hypothetical protein ACYCRH_08360 [Acidiferrobacteraceae bacterium]